MASIHPYKTSKGKQKYFVAYDVYDENGERHQKKKRGFDKKKDAKEFIAEVESAINKGMYIQTPKITVKDYLERWLEVKSINIGSQTVTLYKNSLKNYIYPYIGDILLANLKTEHINNFIHALHTKDRGKGKIGYAYKTIKRSHEIVSAALDYGVDNKLIKANVAKKAILPKEPKRKKIDVWDLEQANQFLETSKNDENNRYHLAYAIAIICGMRQGEILGLTWKDVDLEENLLFVEQTLSHDGKKILEDTKTKKSRRTIEFSESLADQFREQKKIIESEKEKFGDDYQDQDLVICTELGNPINARNVLRKQAKLMKKAGVPKITFHDLRHVHASLMLYFGHDIKEISERLGHAKSSFTYDTYVHIMSKTKKKLIDNLQRSIKL